MAQSFLCQCPSSKLVIFPRVRPGTPLLLLHDGQLQGSRFKLCMCVSVLIRGGVHGMCFTRGHGRVTFIARFH